MAYKMILPNPLYPQFTVRGGTWEDAKDLCEDVSAVVASGPWTQCKVRNSATGALFEPNTGMTFILGEIGLAYLLYRFRDIIDPNDARMFFRIGNYGSLTTLLSGALDRLAHTGQRYSDYHWITLDQELVGILTSYLLVPNSHICSLIKSAELSGRVTRWFWRPTEMAWFIQGGIESHGFRYGAAIYNGETGHRALSFYSSLWTESINGQTYEFTLPIRDVAYARHMPSESLSKAVLAVKDVLTENKLAEAFEQFADLPGSWTASRIDNFVDKAKARDTSKEKLLIAFEDDCILYRPKMAIDYIYQMLQSAAAINKSAANLAHQVVNMMITEVMELPRSPGGAVISDES